MATFAGWWDTKKIYRTTNGGESWVDITLRQEHKQSGLDSYDITVSSENAEHIWMVRTSMYGTPSDGQSYDVFKSTNGGNTWVN